MADLSHPPVEVAHVRGQLSDAVHTTVSYTADVSATVTSTPEDADSKSLHPRASSSPEGPKASDDFNTLKAAGNTNPFGLWADEEIMWVSDMLDGKLYAYDRHTTERVPGRDITTRDSENDGVAFPVGLWADDTTIWVASGTPSLSVAAYNKATGARDSSKDFTGRGRVRPSTGLWMNGTTVWLSDDRVGDIVAYDRQTGIIDQASTISGSDQPMHAVSGLWSDGSTMWAVDYWERMVYAYDLATKQRDPTREIRISAEANTSPMGIWSDGETMWVSDLNADKVFAYYMPPSASQSQQTAGPQPPVGLVGTATDWSVELSWSVPVQPAGVYFDAMVLERLDAGGAVVWSTEVYDDDPAGDDWQQTVRNLDAATGYRFRVKLLVDGGDPVYSKVLAVATQADPPVGPSGLSAVAATGSVALSWGIPAQPAWLAGGGLVDVLRATVSPRTDTEHWVNDGMVWQRGKTSWQFTDTGVWPGFTYRYRIRTVFGDRHQYSDSVEVTIPSRVLDPDSVPGGATALEVRAPTRLPRYYGPYSIHRGGGDAVDYFTFTTDARYQLGLGVDVHDRYIDMDVYLEDAGGDVVAQSSPLSREQTVEWIDALIDPGAYYIRVQAAADGSADYILCLGLTDPSAGALTGFTLVDASDQSVLATLTDGATVTLDDPDGGSYAIRADFDPTASIGSVIFELTGPKTVPAKTENWVPYSLYGDYRNGRVRNLNGEALPAGSYTLKATAYTQKRGGGEVLGTLAVSFTVTSG